MTRRSLTFLRRSDDGAVAIELAIIAPVIAVMLIGVVDLTTAFNRKMELEQALHRSLEKIMNTTTFTTPSQTIREEVVAAVSGVEVGDITVDYLLECDNVIQAQSGDSADPLDPPVTEPTEVAEEPEPEDLGSEEPDASAGCEPTQVQRRYISATVTDEFEPFFPISKMGMAGTAFTITAKAGMRVE